MWDHPHYTLVKDDIRTFDPKILTNVDAVVDLAALSNDPLGELVGDKTYAINHLGRQRVCRMAKQAGGVALYPGLLVFGLRL